ncbi:MAG: TraR/DksA family transcriptional regulator [Woeseiaceae bacterium]|nr:TraR/DksA family transcriptional regulator [Woeseiaceae bacterium]
MSDEAHRALRRRLEQRKTELLERLERIKANVRRGYHADSKERAQELENHEVVDALGNDTRAELARIGATMERLEAGDYGLCKSCGGEISPGRLEAYPYADECIDCAELGEHRRNHRS